MPRQGSPSTPRGAFTFECTDLTTLYDAILPTKLTAQILGAVIGFSSMPEGIHGDESDEHNEQTLLFSDELTLEMWLRQEFIPNLDLLESDDIDEESLADAVRIMVQQIMADVLGNKAKEEVRRTWGV